MSWQLLMSERLACTYMLQMLEDNQVLIQGMMANRYMDTFREPILSWNTKLMAVADVVSLVSEIQVGLGDWGAQLSDSIRLHAWTAALGSCTADYHVSSNH